jgi:cystathionine beta-lyase/cystathionine gamma-synthase
MKKNGSVKTATTTIHAGYDNSDFLNAVAPPLFFSSTFAQHGVGNHAGYEYARTNNPTREILEKTMAELENASGCAAFATGLAALTTLMLSLRAGDHVVVSANVYGGTYRLFETVFVNFGLSFSFVDSTDIENVRNVIRPETVMIYIETPTNPLLEITDIRAVAALAGEHKLSLCVDNTFMTPIFQKPLDCGADYVLHSATKYLGGHSDVLGGFLCMKHEKDNENIHRLQNSAGAVLSPFDSWLILRGLKTLHVRMKQHEKNALQIAEFLKTHPQVKSVFYPGLKSHPGYEKGLSQSSGFGGMLSFDYSGDVERFLSRLQIFTLAESLGAVESLVCQPARMTHASIPEDERKKRGINDYLLRLSVGIEDVDDLLADLADAL